MSGVKRYMTDCNLLRSLGKVREEDVIVVLAKDYDALAQQLATITADRDAEKAMKATARMQRDKMTQQLAASRAVVKASDDTIFRQSARNANLKEQLAARDKQLADAVGYLKWLRATENISIDETKRLDAFLTTIEQDKEND